MGYQSYGQIKQLESDIIEKLLSNGDAQERVWAAWEIGLRLGKKALSRISLQTYNAPDAGTRRHLIVVIAGLGNYSVLSTLATLDPNESVRSTASQYLIRITNQNDKEKINLIISILAKDKSPIVKQSILANWDFLQKQIPKLLLLDCAINEFEDVRNAAIKQIVNNYSVSNFSTEQIVDLLAYQMTKESIYLFSNWLLNWNLQDAIILSAEKAQESSILIILDFLVEKNLTFSWDSLRNLFQIRNPHIDYRLLRLLKIEENLDLVMWLAFGIARAINLPKIKSRSQYLEQIDASNFYNLAKNHFLLLIKVMIPHKINPYDFKNFQTILNHIEKDIDYFNEDDDEDFWEDEDINPEKYIKEVKLNCACIKKWMSVNAL